MPHDGRRAPRWEGESRDDAVGPQGAALILELQRLRQAFELEDGDGRRAASASSGPRGVASCLPRANASADSGNAGARWDGPSTSAWNNWDSPPPPRPRAEAKMHPNRRQPRPGAGANPRPSRLSCRPGGAEASPHPSRLPPRSGAEASKYASRPSRRSCAEPSRCARRLPLRPREEANPNVSRHPRRRRAGAARSSRPTTPP